MADGVDREWATGWSELPETVVEPVAEALRLASKLPELERAKGRAIAMEDGRVVVRFDLLLRDRVRV